MAKKAMSEAHKRAISKAMKRRYAAKKRAAPPAVSSHQTSDGALVAFVLARASTTSLVEELGRRVK